MDPNRDQRSSATGHSRCDTWASFGSELGVGERPAVDSHPFHRHRGGGRAAPSGGHEIAVSRISQAAGALTIESYRDVPGPNLHDCREFDQPVDVVVIPAANVRNWNFAERKEVRGCR